MKIAAYQASLEATYSIDKIIGDIRNQIDWCELNGVEILCCPEGVLGGLADYVDKPTAIALEAGDLQKTFAPLVSDKVATILGFTEIDDGRLYNSAAVFHKGRIHGIYRKLYPAINKSVYTAGNETPVFKIGDLTFGIIICNDSNFVEPAERMTAQGAMAIFVPANNGLPAKRFGAELIEHTREVDVARATENNVYIIRADVAGRTVELVAYGTSEIVGPDGAVLASAQRLVPDLIVAEISVIGGSLAAGNGLL